VNLKEEIS